MGKDVKIGLALGLVVIVVAIVIFSVSGRDRRPTTPPEEALPGESALGPEAAREGPAGPGPAPIPDPFRATVLPPGPPPFFETRGDTRDSRPPSILADYSAPPPTLARTIEHVVRASDTLWDLGRRYYGDAGRGAARIQAANRDQLPRLDSMLRVGMKLKVPDAPADRSGGDRTGPAPAGPAPAVEGTREAVAPPPAAQYDEYLVQRGDTLSIIANRFYGNDRMTQPIVAANAALLTNPNRLRIGWRLRIPKVAGVERTAARRDID